MDLPRKQSSRRTAGSGVVWADGEQTGRAARVEEADDEVEGLGLGAADEPARSQ